MNENKVIFSERRTKSMIHSPKFCEPALVQPTYANRRPRSAAILSCPDSKDIGLIAITTRC
jgi:hypothetical protein